MDKFEQLFAGGDTGHIEEAVCQLIVSGCDCAVDLGAAKHTLDAVGQLVAHPFMFDLHAPV